jgi:hypothetical protein
VRTFAGKRIESRNRFIQYDEFSWNLSFLVTSSVGRPPTAWSPEAGLHAA